MTLIDRLTLFVRSFIAQRGAINRLKAELARYQREDIMAIRRERNKMAGQGVVADKIRNLNNENDVLAQHVRELREKMQ